MRWPADFQDVSEDCDIEGFLKQIYIASMSSSPGLICQAEQTARSNRSLARFLNIVSA